MFKTPPARSALGRHRQLAPTASVRVSPLCLGAMNFGEAHSAFLGECDKQTSFAILDKFYELGGNFIDTANGYQNGESEEWVGEWMKERGNRDQIVLATKFTSFYMQKAGNSIIQSNYTGNNAKSLKLSVKASLKKLQTDYIDLLYVHWWDYTTNIPELMQDLNDLVRSGAVLYLGVSDTPAWVVAKANQYARDHGLRQFSVYQGLWNAAIRDIERDIVPMCADSGMALCPWGPIGQGRFHTAEQFKEREKGGDGRKIKAATDLDKQVSKVLEDIASDLKTTIHSVALAYISQKAPYVFPIIGGRRVEHLEANVGSLELHLTDEVIAKIDGAYDFQYGFPHAFLSDPFEMKSAALKSADVSLLKPGGEVDWVEAPRAIKPKKA